jgi:hypothetical protein
MFSGLDHYLGTSNRNCISYYCSLVYKTNRKILKQLINTGTGAAARAATFLTRIVQNQKINYLEPCMEKRKV